MTENLHGAEHAVRSHSRRAVGPPATLALVPFFLLLYDVVPDYLERRAEHRAEHLTLARAELRLGGAFADPADGAAIVFEGPDRSVAERFVHADPYVRHGLVRTWTVRAWTVVVGADLHPPEPD
jgi:uncharacterized protein YciI